MACACIASPYSAVKFLLHTCSPAVLVAVAVWVVSHLSHASAWSSAVKQQSARTVALHLQMALQRP